MIFLTSIEDILVRGINEGNADSLLNLIHEKEREYMAKRTARGLKRAREQGKVILGRVPYGYRCENGKLLIQQEESEVVMKIFNYLKIGKSYTDVSVLLNKEGYFYKNDLPWNPVRIRWIAKSRIYIGELYYNKTSTNYKNGTASTVKNPPNEWAKITVPAIIPLELFESVQFNIAVLWSKKK